jgi:thiamine kinase-like enzyme
MTQGTNVHWKEYTDSTLRDIQSILEKQLFSLDTHQPHLLGERFLMQAVTTTSGRKLILLGTENTTGKKVVIKVTNDQSGKEELRQEKHCRQLLNSLPFAYNLFHSPKELLFLEQNDYVISVHEFITQTSSFLERPLEDQFSFALQALKDQELARATTSTHIKLIAHTFGNRSSSEYLALFVGFIGVLKNKLAPAKTITVMQEALEHLKKNTKRIEQYCNFLTHTDFVPHNFRIKDKRLYLLDFSSLKFGNKHESWARFLNFMTLYNRELETLFITYVEKNRSAEERESLQLMRIFRLGELVTYYTSLLEKSTDALLELNTLRVQFWTDVLTAELANTRVSEAIVDTYRVKRDALRSTEEKKRQEGLH